MATCVYLYIYIYTCYVGRLLFFLLDTLGWLAEVRANGDGVKIVPRVLFEGWSATDYQNLFKSSSKMKELAEYLAQRTVVSWKSRYMITGVDVTF